MDSRNARTVMVSAILSGAVGILSGRFEILPGRFAILPGSVSGSIGNIGLTIVLGVLSG